MRKVLTTIANFAAIVAILASSPVAATTFVPMSDAALSDQARAAIAGRVVSATPSAIGDQPATEYLVEVDRVLKGEPVAGTILVRVPGGAGFDGVGLRLDGAPVFSEGEEVVLFLASAADGSYRIQQFLLGAFHVRRESGRKLALRELGGAMAAGEQGLSPAQDTAVREAEKFSDWIEDRARGWQRPVDYFAAPAGGGMASVSAPFTHMTYAKDSLPIRWFSFERGQTQDWRVAAEGQPGLGTEATVVAFVAAMEAWTSEPSTDIRYNFAGLTSAGAGFSRSDRQNTILFGDPHGDAEGAFSCAEGGVLAIGGPYFSVATRTHNGQRYHEATEGDIVTNDGTECYFRNNPKVAQEVFAHELGHTLGLGHSSNREALMYSRAHNDGRGAQISEDDYQGVFKMYGNGAPGGPTRETPPRAAQRLAARATSSTEVALVWRDRATNEDRYRLEVKVGAGPFVVAAILPANSTTTLVGGLRPNTAYRFRVRAENAKGKSGYSNVARVITPRN